MKMRRWAIEMWVGCSCVRVCIGRPPSLFLSCGLQKDETSWGKVPVKREQAKLQMYNYLIFLCH